ncbi:hypothetical protein V5O48_011513 [Marasmius crinis-equi]|uniref:Uncharacterized protein n=1 Tax=Marasmius crinis-equi TaxID=585013 RepID=A0ABR3F5C6_9AGAR
MLMTTVVASPAAATSGGMFITIPPESQAPKNIEDSHSHVQNIFPRLSLASPQTIPIKEVQENHGTPLQNPQSLDMLRPRPENFNYPLCISKAGTRCIASLLPLGEAYLDGPLIAG